MTLDENHENALKQLCKLFWKGAWTWKHHGAMENTPYAIITGRLVNFNLSLDLDFEFVHCVAHLLWSLILSLYLVCSSILKFDPQMNFKFNTICVVCLFILSIVWILSYNLIFKWTSSTTLVVCYAFIYFINCCSNCSLILKGTSSTTLFICCLFICFINCYGSCNLIL